QRLDAADGRDAPVDLERPSPTARCRPSSEPTATRCCGASRRKRSWRCPRPIGRGFISPCKEKPPQTRGSIAGQDLNLRPPRYEPPRLCTPVPPYSAEMQAPKTVLGHCGAPRTR